MRTFDKNNLLQKNFVFEVESLQTNFKQRSTLFKTRTHRYPNPNLIIFVSTIYKPGLQGMAPLLIVFPSLGCYSDPLLSLMLVPSSRSPFASIACSGFKPVRSRTPHASSSWSPVQPPLFQRKFSIQNSEGTDGTSLQNENTNGQKDDIKLSGNSCVGTEGTN